MTERLGPKLARSVSAYDRLLASIGDRAAEIEPRPVLVHWPHVGSAYDGTVIVGQALRGWADKFPASSFRTPDGRARAIETARERPDRAEPMDWIATHHVKNSPFWRTARLLVEALEPDHEFPWYARWCWLNLFPCAPDDPPENPGGPLREAQDPFVGELLAAHADLLDARRVIALVGPFWWPAAGPAGLGDLPEVPSPLLRAGRDDSGRTWVVGWHPNGASHRGWGPTRYAQLIVDRIRAIEIDN
jgi:hypothetical protein